jgi:hypothetical protein
MLNLLLILLAVCAVVYLKKNSDTLSLLVNEVLESVFVWLVRIFRGIWWLIILPFRLVRWFFTAKPFARWAPSLQRMGFRSYEGTIFFTLILLPFLPLLLLLWALAGLLKHWLGSEE